jgi:hypothetical protein
MQKITSMGHTLMTSFYPNDFSKGSSPNTITLRVRASANELCEGNNPVHSTYRKPSGISVYPFLPL